MKRHILRVGRSNPGGVTATCRDASGALVSFGAPGAARVALRAICARCDRDGLRIVCLSTPQTIYVDLVGREPGRNRPEIAMLGLVGRCDLLG